MGLSKIKIGGVPEHFNLPIHLANEKGLFAEAGIEIELINFGGGTGEMTKALRENEVDICVLLTEGIAFDIVNGNKSKIISEYGDRVIDVNYLKQMVYVDLGEGKIVKKEYS